jgi:hypothetical protein
MGQMGECSENCLDSRFLSTNPWYGVNAAWRGFYTPNLMTPTEARALEPVHAGVPAQWKRLQGTVARRPSLVHPNHDRDAGSINKLAGSGDDGNDIWADPYLGNDVEIFRITTARPTTPQSSL